MPLRACGARGAMPAAAYRDGYALIADDATAAARDAIDNARSETVKVYSGEPMWTFQDGTNPLRAVCDELAASIARTLSESVRKLSEVQRQKMKAAEASHAAQLEKVRATAASGYPWERSKHGPRVLFSALPPSRSLFHPAPL